MTPMPILIFIGLCSLSIVTLCWFAHRCDQEQTRLTAEYFASLANRRAQRASLLLRRDRRVNCRAHRLALWLRFQQAVKRAH